MKTNEREETRQNNKDDFISDSDRVNQNEINGMSADKLLDMIPSGFAVLSIEEEQKIRTLYVSPKGNAIFGGTPEDYRENYQGRVLPEWPFTLEEKAFSQQDVISLMQGRTIEVMVPSATIQGEKIWLRAFCNMKTKD